MGLRTLSGYILDQRALIEAASSSLLLLDDTVDNTDASCFWEKRVGLGFKVEVISELFTNSAAGSSSLWTILGEVGTILGEVEVISTSTVPYK